MIELIKILPAYLPPSKALTIFNSQDYGGVHE